MRRFWFFAFIVVLFAAASARADVVAFKNGDRLSGTWVQAEPKDLIFNSDALGRVTIPLSKIESFSSGNPAVALLKQGGAVQGLIFLLPTGVWELAVENGLKTIKPGEILTILPEKTYRHIGGERPPSLWVNWKGMANAGYSIERGDTDAGTVSTSFNAERLQPEIPGVPVRWRTHYNLDMLFAHARTASSGAEISSNTLTSAIRQDYLFDDNNFVYGLAQLDHIQPQALDLRQSYGGGFGKDVRHTSRMTLSLLGGLTYVDEDFKGAPRRQNLEGFTGERLKMALSRRVSLVNTIDLYPSITSAGLFRGDASSTLSVRLNSRLTMNTSLQDFYLGQPPTGSRPNNFTATTGVGIIF